MDNTVQMHKPVPQAAKWRSVVFVHDHWKQRLYYLPTEETGVKERLRAKQVRALCLMSEVARASGLKAVCFRTTHSMLRGAACRRDLQRRSQEECIPDILYWHMHCQFYIAKEAGKAGCTRTAQDVMGHGESVAYVCRRHLHEDPQSGLQRSR